VVRWINEELKVLQISTNSLVWALIFYLKLNPEHFWMFLRIVRLKSSQSIIGNVVRATVVHLDRVIRLNGAIHAGRAYANENS
jgi:hypothetical protein